MRTRRRLVPLSWIRYAVRCVDRALWVLHLHLRDWAVLDDPLLNSLRCSRQAAILCDGISAAKGRGNAVWYLKRLNDFTSSEPRPDTPFWHSLWHTMRKYIHILTFYLLFYIFYLESILTFYLTFILTCFLEFGRRLHSIAISSGPGPRIAGFEALRGGACFGGGRRSTRRGGRNCTFVKI